MNQCVEIRPADQNGYIVLYGPLEVWFARISNARKFAAGLADECPIVIFDRDGNFEACYDPAEWRVAATR